MYADVILFVRPNRIHWPTFYLDLAVKIAALEWLFYFYFVTNFLICKYMLFNPSMKYAS